MSRLRFQAESKESKDPIRGNKLLRPYPIEEKIKITHEENPRDRAVGYAKELAGTTVTARNVQLPGKVYTQPGCQDEGPPRSDKENAEFAWEDTHTKILEARPRSKITQHCNTLTHRKKSLLNVMRAWVHVYSKTARQSTSHLEA